MTQDNTSGYRDTVTGRSEPDPPAPGATQIPPASSPEIKSLLGIVVAALCVTALYFAKDVLIPVMLAVMLSFVLSPLVNLLQRMRLWRAPAVIVAVLATLGVIGLIGTLIGSQAAALSTNAPQYARTIEAKVEGVQSYAVTSIAAITKMFGTAKRRPRPGEPAPPVLTPALPGSSVGAGEVRRPVLVEMAPEEASPITIARAILAPIIGPLETTFIVLVVAIFVLLQKEDLRDRFIRVFGSHDLHRTTLAMDDAGQRLSNYFLSQLLVNTGFGIVIGLGLWAIGLPSPAMWGILAGLLRFVPYIGSFIAAIAPIALGAAIDPGWMVAIYVALLFVIVEPLIGYVVEPMLYGHSTGLSPVSVIISAVFWTWLWGPIGLIMSTPLTLCLVVLGRHVKNLEFFDVLLGDRPALSPVETFYQRILANNPDEALVQAEQFLSDRPLIQYYDEVVLEGLKLAADDEARGTIDRSRSIQMVGSMSEVIEDLGDQAAAGQAMPAAEGVTAPNVVCIAGRGSFDASISAIIVQLLEKRGITAQILPLASLSREAIASLDLDGFDIIVFSHLGLSSAPLRLLRRLRQRAPVAKILVCPWPGGESVPNAPAEMPGADDYCESFRKLLDSIASDANAQTAGRTEPAELA
ncbi:AI-2E family transporter [Novosphingobium sp. G106]|uniref:AI-2E family transporter n=1 Tax=Novosphingobium sp. G106 TaxID=2849500 RepID=UPI001C2CDD5C|nr:AI-2E family transporter [Novosphingobium sp. G106]MBV1688518.1 AI-2E family transporter [Novosphingobium sp. G106]